MEASHCLMVLCHAQWAALFGLSNISKRKKRKLGGTGAGADSGRVGGQMDDEMCK